MCWVHLNTPRHFGSDVAGALAVQTLTLTRGTVIRGCSEELSVKLRGRQEDQGHSEDEARDRTYLNYPFVAFAVSDQNGNAKFT